MYSRCFYILFPCCKSKKSKSAKKSLLAQHSSGSAELKGLAKNISADICTYLDEKKKKPDLAPLELKERNSAEELATDLWAKEEEYERQKLKLSEISRDRGHEYQAQEELVQQALEAWKAAEERFLNNQKRLAMGEVWTEEDERIFQSIIEDPFGLKQQGQATSHNSDVTTRPKVSF